MNFVCQDVRLLFDEHKEIVTICENKDGQIKRLRKECKHTGQMSKMSEEDMHHQQAKLQQSITVTHILESQGQALSAGQNCSKMSKPLTNLSIKNQHDQQGRIAGRYSHLLPEEPRTPMINKLELWQETTATHFLKSQGQA